jgi:hypothetical protein
MKITDISTGAIHLEFKSDTSTQWQDNADRNITFVRLMMAYAKDKLAAQGHLFVNDVLYELGMPKTPEGQVLGWVRKNNGPLWDIAQGDKDVHIALHIDGVVDEI